MDSFVYRDLLVVCGLAILNYNVLIIVIKIEQGSKVQCSSDTFKNDAN